MNRDEARFPMPADDCVLRIGTYTLEDLIYLPPCPHDQIVTQVDVDEGHFSVVEYDLELAPDSEPELMRVRCYRSPADHKAGRTTLISTGLQEVFSMYLQDDKARWNDAKNWIEANGEAISVRRAA